MNSIIEINRPLVAALRMSEALPNTNDHGSGAIHLLYAEGFRPVGYLVEKVSRDDAWENPEPRFFITTAHADALRLLATPFHELSTREVVAG